jgi:hypothetical protein
VDGGVVREMLAGTEPGSARIDWDGVEAWLGTSLPADYRMLADRFGSLFVGEWLWVHAPVRLEGYPPFDRELGGVRAGARDACAASGIDAPVFHPKRGGLLPFGSGRGGEGLFWDTSSRSPDEWPVVVLAHAPGAYGNAGWIRTDLPLTAFLEAVVTTGVSEAGVAVGPYPPTAERAYGGPAASYWKPPDRAARNDPRRRALTKGSGLAALQVLVPPPAVEPVVVGSERPGDYRALMEVYGAGTWRGWLQVWHPEDLEPADGRGRLAGVLGMRPDDFLPFADSIDGDVLGWVRQGPPDRWPLAWVPRHTDPGPAVPMSLTAALLRWLRGYDDPVFAPSDPDLDLVDQATFEPSDRR